MDTFFWENKLFYLSLNCDISIQKVIPDNVPGT